MGSYDTHSKFTSTSSCSRKLLNVLLKATLDGFRHGDEYDQQIPEYFGIPRSLFSTNLTDEFDNGFDTLEISDYNLEIWWNEEFGLDSDSISKFHEYLGRSIFAMDSTSRLESSYECFYSGGGGESGGFTIKDGVFTELYHGEEYCCCAYLDGDTFDEFQEKLETADTDEEIDQVVREFCSIEGRNQRIYVSLHMVI